LVKREFLSFLFSYSNKAWENRYGNCVYFNCEILVLKDEFNKTDDGREAENPGVNSQAYQDVKNFKEFRPPIGNW
jgi:hypothetical protein